MNQVNHDRFVFFVLLADRTNSRTYATVLRLSPSLSVVCNVIYCG